MSTVRALFLFLLILAAPSSAATSYANSGGTGNRQYLIAIRSQNIAWGSGGSRSPYYLVDGTLANTVWFDSSSAGADVVYDFGTAKVIDEAKWYQDNSTSQGTWQWAGSNDDSSYTNIGSSFTLGGSTVDTITSLNGNTTAYQYYRMSLVSGSTSSNPFTQGIEFKISAIDATIPDYGNTYGQGDRTASLTVSQSLTTGTGNIIFGFSGVPNPDLSQFVDGQDLLDATHTMQFDSTHLAVTGKWIRWDFPSAQVIDEFRFYYTIFGDLATWQWQGSNDGTNWTDIGSAQQITTPGTSFDVQRIYLNSAFITVSIFTGCHGNTTGYLFYRMLGTSGSVLNDSSLKLYEIAFRIKAAPATTTNTAPHGRVM